MRRLLSFQCAGETLGASVDEAAGPLGVLMVTGGGQTRIGSHRMYERLAARLADHGHPCFRFDRRGVGDSEGNDPGFRACGPDLAAAAHAFRQEGKGLEKVIGFGLCDGATALALFGAAANLDGLILVNPWFVEAEAGVPPPAAIRKHYRQRLTSLDGWKRALTGSMSYGKLLKGIVKILAPPPSSLASEAADALGTARLPVRLILARGDATAIAAEAEWNAHAFRKVRDAAAPPLRIDSDSHTFARGGDLEALLQACLASIETLSGGD
ncbi:hydrolase 1, exosortase A system-associated [Sphingosinicella rhizophila]|uniref:Hydrolase 1, exosortase A system-associated n=1 Tax=Sphingosinicella rhizophila TaxID=3050082 RepID=A0ABU3Q3B9_9SPHN|nr:hydrolase 1, exosortase A system-associated [Sphingosinicella sp. GR2756]MDT9597767.1 hydrolase 1, exosortase A system-associated [Sphingosinicella sp. GR2756]